VHLPPAIGTPIVNLSQVLCCHPSASALRPLDTTVNGASASDFVRLSRCWSVDRSQRSKLQQRSIWAWLLLRVSSTSLLSLSDRVTHCQSVRSWIRVQHDRRVIRSARWPAPLHAHFRRIDAGSCRSVGKCGHQGEEQEETTAAAATGGDRRAKAQRIAQPR